MKDLYRYRYQTLLSLVVGWFLYYACRKTFSSTMPHLMTHRGFTKEDLGLIASSFSVSYGIWKLLFGIIADHVNARKLFSTGLLLSGISVVLFSLGRSVFLCCIFWFIQGVVQGLGWPAALKLLKAWCSQDTLGLWWSIVSSGASLSSALSPLIIAYVSSTTSWYVNYYVIGGVSSLLALSMYVTIADVSMTTTRTRKDDEKKEKIDHPTFSYFDLLMCKELWLVTFIYFILYIGKYSIYDWGQLYLIQHLKLKETSAGAYVGMIQFGGVFGNIVWGYISDKTLFITPRGSKVPRGPVLLSSCILLTLCFYLFSSFLNEVSSELVVTLVCFSTGLMLEGCVSLIGLAAMESAPDQLTGSAHALSCAFGQVGGFIAGWPFSVIVSMYSWVLAYQLLTLTSVLMVIATIYLAALGFRTSKLHSK